jgi:hypothetical protein
MPMLLDRGDTPVVLDVRAPQYLKKGAVIATALFSCDASSSIVTPSAVKPRALAFFEKPLRFRGLLAQAEEDEVAARLDDSDLASAARQIRELDAAAA